MNPIPYISKMFFQTLPCPAEDFFEPSTLILAFDGFSETYIIFSYVFMFSIAIFEMTFFSACCIYYLVFSTTTQISSTTRKFQLRSFWAITIQTLIPLLFVIIPITATMTKEKQGYSQVQNNQMVILFLMHNGVASLSILLAHAPYRKFLKSLIVRERQNYIVFVSREFMK